jgi:hypothetical protein
MRSSGLFTWFPRGIAAAALLAVLCGCGPRKIGYGVLLWSPDNALTQTGAVLPVYAESRLKQTYTVPVPSPDKPDAVADIPVWRLRFFQREDEALAFAEEFAAVRELYATSDRNALPVREKADRLSRQVYRLRRGETMKVLALSSEMTDENGLKGYWYRVLTEEGVAGFCFNYYLTLFNETTGEVLSSPQSASRETIDHILSASWRPAYFRDMAATGFIDLTRFRAAYGLFFDEEPRQIRIILPSVVLTAPYTRLRRASGDLYIAEGSDLQLQLRAGGSEISVSYSQDTSRRTEVFVELKEDAETVIKAEEERRKNALANFIRRGEVLYSDAYGEIRLDEGGDFIWSGFERLVPAVIPQGARNSGSIEFSVFSTRDARESWTGIVTFRFSGDTAYSVDFFYRFTDQGTQLAHIPPENIEENLVRRRTRNPLVLFFTPAAH